MQKLSGKDFGRSNEVKWRNCGGKIFAIVLRVNVEIMGVKFGYDNSPSG